MASRSSVNSVFSAIGQNISGPKLLVAVFSIFLLAAHVPWQRSEIDLPVVLETREEMAVMDTKDEAVSLNTGPIETRKAVAAREAKEVAELDPTFEVMHGADVVWQIPQKPRGVLFLAHGCTHYSLHFWDTHKNCPECYGLPEDRAIVGRALKRRYAVIAVSSAGTCWQSMWPPDLSQDAGVVRDILADWTRDHGLTKLPMYALGASSGGYFITVLAHKVEFRALVVMIAGGVEHAFTQPYHDDTVPFPPTLFVHMPRDERTALAVKKAVGVLRERGSQAAELQCNPLPITPDFLAERINGLDKDTSKEIFMALSRREYLDKDGFLTRDPRSSPWRALLKAKKILKPPPADLPKAAGAETIQWEEDIYEELNLAFGYHEMTSIYIDEMLDWFQGKCFMGVKYRKKRCKSYPSA